MLILVIYHIPLIQTNSLECSVYFNREVDIQMDRKPYEIEKHVSITIYSWYFPLFAGSSLASGSQGTRQGTKLFSKQTNTL